MSRTGHLRLPFFDAEHRAFAERLDEWAGEATTEIEGDRGHGDVDALCKAWVRALGKGGWLGYCVPKGYGGAHDQLRSLYLRDRARDAWRATPGLPISPSPCRASGAARSRWPARTN